MENPEEAYRFYQTAPIGESNTLTLKPLGPILAGAIPKDPNTPMTYGLKIKSPIDPAP